MTKQELKSQSSEQLLDNFTKAVELDVKSDGNGKTPFDKDQLYQELKFRLGYAEHSSLSAKLQRSLDDVNTMNISDDHKLLLREIKTFAVDLAEHLDPEHITSYQQIDSIYKELLDRAQFFRKILEKFKEWEKPNQ